MIMTSDKRGCREIAAALAAFGVKYAVTSPGSRNAPLIMAIERHGGFNTIPVVDERSAAFIALGIASACGNMVALICTSGTALLNQTPAIAEAYYRQVPLVVISADRPHQWIDQDDSQTIRQNGALSAIVKASYNIKGEAETTEDGWFVNRTLNDALLTAQTGRRGPVHINVELSMPLTGEKEQDGSDNFRKIETIDYPETIPNDMARAMAAELADKRVLIFGGFMPPSAKLSRAMSVMTGLPNIALLAEGLANLHGKGIWERCEALMGNLSESGISRLKPDVLITFGGSPVAAAWKRVARQWKVKEHWHVGKNDATIDTYMSLTRRVDMTAEGFFPKTATALSHLHRKGLIISEYAQNWQEYASETYRLTDRMLSNGNDENWHGASAIASLLSKIPSDWNLQLSNGMSCRYAMLNRLGRFHRVDCNRGVSGIDGSLSTAVGASMVYNKPTLLITGDMSAQYDMGALASTVMNNRFKMVVINNGGGGIFSFVKTTATMPERDRLLKCELRLPLRQIAEAYGMVYANAPTFAELDHAAKLLVEENKHPVVVEIVTNAERDAEMMWKIIKNLYTNDKIK